ncbi:MAG: hypothetical protein EOO71_41430 [Myxococcaceae bacterium]|nr:MAG: hypothetical protein EOO71_41430 [Myxococcaceae bacterium]
MPVHLIKFETLKTEAKQEKKLVYLWDQASDGRISSRGGVCLGMSMDWLRRKMAGGKNFDHAEFADRKARTNLATKHITIHDLQLKAPTTALTMEYALQLSKLNHDPKAVHSKFLYLADKEAQEFGWKELQALTLKKVVVDRERPPAAAFTSIVASALLDLEDEPHSKYQGLILQLDSEEQKVGHAVAFFIREPLMDEEEARRRRLERRTVYEFFDPNVGEFRFVQDPKGLVAFLVKLWEALYNDMPTLIPHQVWYTT